MTDPANFRLRVTFCKQGRLSMLSHLELARALERAVRRAGLPYAISQGFSPHMKIAFGAALPVGVGGTQELFDLQMTRYVRPQEALEALQRASVPDLMPSAARYIEHTAPAASVAFPVSTYDAVLAAPPEGGVAVPETVTVVRKKKEKELVVGDYLVEGPTLWFRAEDGIAQPCDASDGRPFGVSGDAGAQPEGAGAYPEDGGIDLGSLDGQRGFGVGLSFKLESKPTGSLRPDILLANCTDAAGSPLQVTSITRVAQEV